MGNLGARLTHGNSLDMQGLQGGALDGLWWLGSVSFLGQRLGIGDRGPCSHFTSSGQETGELHCLRPSTNTSLTHVATYRAGLWLALC